MQLLNVVKLGTLGVVGALLITVGAVKHDDIIEYGKQKLSGVITDAEAQSIYNQVARATGQGDIIPRPLTIDNSNQINAYTTVAGITIYRGLLRLINKDELALILGHEISHFVLGHVFLPSDTQTKDNVRIEEMQADKYGAILSMRAGYNICEGRQFFKILDRQFGDNQDQDHPDFAFRYDQLNINCGG